MKTNRHLHEQYPGFEDFALHRDADGSVWLWGYGEYPAYSVLSGQHREARLECYETEQEAGLATGLDVSYGHGGPCAVVPTFAPDGFDPADAGEAWSEEDY